MRSPQYIVDLNIEASVPFAAHGKSAHFALAPSLAVAFGTNFKAERERITTAITHHWTNIA
jgi:hypothetical protein